MLCSTRHIHPDLIHCPSRSYLKLETPCRSERHSSIGRSDRDTVCGHDASCEHAFWGWRRTQWTVRGEDTAMLAIRASSSRSGPRLKRYADFCLSPELMLKMTQAHLSPTLITPAPRLICSISPMPVPCTVSLATLKPTSIPTSDCRSIQKTHIVSHQTCSPGSHFSSHSKSPSIYLRGPNSKSAFGGYGMERRIGYGTNGLQRHSYL